MYEDSNPEYIRNLEKSIKAHIADKIEDHRSELGRPTSWDTDNSDIIKTQLLTTFEQFKYKMRPYSIDDPKTAQWYIDASQSLEKIKMVDEPNSVHS